ncbi:MAG: ATP-independent RNA helicase DbpA [Planctomycetota bacterium]|jgi:ATP-independent RNA helicase DbpA
MTVAIGPGVATWSLEVLRRPPLVTPPGGSTGPGLHRASCGLPRTACGNLALGQAPAPWLGYFPGVESSFEALSLSPKLLEVVRQLGYERPTPIQVEAIPVLLAGRDLVGQAQTGSGKTAAFALPILDGLDLDARTLQALVLCPTRELAAQVAREFRKLGRAHPGLSVLELVGGQPARPQREALQRGVHIAIATPGRLLDHIQRKALDVETVRTVVLDEADRMLDMGFGEDVGRILGSLRGQRQTALFSATFPDSIEELSQRFQRNALRVTVDAVSESQTDIRQMQLVVNAEDGLHALSWVLNAHPHESALVFCNFKATVARLVQALASAGVSVARLDGDLDQFHRDQVLACFRNQSVRILIATDVAGRGLDVEGLDLVINYELPSQPEIYVHRIGRTGRAGQQGVAVSLTRGRGDTRLDAVEELVGTKLGLLKRDAGNDPGLTALLKRAARGAKNATILISGGRKDKVRAGDILGALTGQGSSLSGKDIGKIEVQDRLAYVAVARRHQGEAVHLLNRGRIKGKKFRATLIDAIG